MPRGTSGRIVIEVDPEVKEQLYAALDRDGLKLKYWFLDQVDEYLHHGTQLSLRFDDMSPTRRVGE